MTAAPSHDQRGAQLRRELRQALGSGALELYFQPQIELISGELVGVEALLRLRIDGKLTAPADHIVAAEASDLIIMVGEWVFCRALTAARQWLRDRPNVHVAVNVSPAQLHDPTLGQRLQRLLDASGLPANQLCLEITETAPLHLNSQSRQLLDDITRRGIRLALDDFGTGHSHADHLDLPVTYVKIDRGDVWAADENPDARKRICELITAAHARGLTVIAEGVETPQQRQMLIDLGVELAQGYLFSRPQPLDELARGPWPLHQA